MGIDDIVADIESKLQELDYITEAVALTKNMDANDVGSVLAYTHDLHQPDDVKDGNLYFEANKDHRCRDATGRSVMMKRWGVYTHYALKGFSKLPNFEGDVFRGLPDRATIIKEYQIGRPIQWGAFT